MNSLKLIASISLIAALFQCYSRAQESSPPSLEHVLNWGIPSHNLRLGFAIDKYDLNRSDLNLVMVCIYIDGSGNDVPAIFPMQGLHRGVLFVVKKKDNTESVVSGDLENYSIASRFRRIVPGEKTPVGFAIRKSELIDLCKKAAYAKMIIYENTGSFVLEVPVVLPKDD